MKTSIQTSRNSFSAAFSLLLTFCIFCCFSLTSANSTQAQGSVFVPIQQVSNSITYPSGTFNSGDPITLEIQLGDPAIPVQNLLAISLELHLSNKADVPAASAVDLSYSWLGTQLINTSSVDLTNSIVHIDASRPDGSWISGVGEIARITLTSPYDNISASELVNSLEGGITIVENVDMRLAQPTASKPETKPVTCFPNPFADHLTIEGLNSQEAFRIFDATGKVVHTAFANDSGWLAIGVQGWPAGIYFLHTESGTRKRIVKQ